MGCQTTKAFGMDSAEVGITRTQFRRVVAAFRRMMKSANPAMVLGKYGQLYALRSIAIDVASTAYLGSGSIQKFAGHLTRDIKVTDTFKNGLAKLSDTSIWQYTIGGRNYFLQAAGGGTHDNVFTRAILWPNKRIDLAYNHYVSTKTEKLHELFSKHNIEPRSAKAKLLGEMLNVDLEGVNLSGDMAEMVDDFRALLDELHTENNIYREQIGREQVDYRGNYFPHILQVAKLMKVLSTEGGAAVASQATDPETKVQDFLRNPRDLVETGPTKRRGERKREYDLDPTRVLDAYIVMMSKDIFENEAARHNWNHITALHMENRRRQEAIIDGTGADPLLTRIEADLIEYTKVRYQNQDPLMTREFNEKLAQLPGMKMARDAAVSVHHQLIQAVFPFNWKWSLLIQPQSALLIPVRYGVKSTVQAAKTLFTDPEFRNYVVNTTYAGIIKKTGGGGSFVDQTTGARNQLKEDRYGPRGRLSEFLMENGGGGLVRFHDVSRQAGVWMSDAMETNLSILAAGAAKISGEKQGLKGRALQEYISDGIAKTQSMYNFADRSGFLQSKEVGAVVPFQSFMNELFNLTREMGLPLPKVRNVMLAGAVGRTGTYQEFDTHTKMGGLVVAQRWQSWAYLMGGAAVANLLVNHLDDREPWQAQNFVPFASVIFGTGVGNKSAVLPVAYTTELAKAFHSYIEYGDFTKTRSFLIKHHQMGGLQANRTLSGLEAIYHGGIKDRNGRTMIELGPDNAFSAVLNGPWKTGPGREYWNSREG